MRYLLALMKMKEAENSYVTLKISSPDTHCKSNEGQWTKREFETRAQIQMRPRSYGPLMQMNSPLLDQSLTNKFNFVAKSK